MAVKHLIFLGTKKDNHVLGALQTKCRTYFGCPKMIKSLTKLDFHVGHHNVILTLCEGSERLTAVGARDTCVSKNIFAAVK